MKRTCWTWRCRENSGCCLTGFCSCKTSIHYIHVNKRFPKKHNLMLFGQRDLLYYLSMNINEDIKSRITYSETLHGLNDQGMEVYIQSELDAVRLGANTFVEGAIELILRSVQGNLRACRNLCYGSLVEACRENKKIVSLTHVNNVLVQPHWRSHEALIKQQAD